MHGSGEFLYKKLGSTDGGYDCDKDCLKLNSFTGKRTFTTNFVAAKPVAKAALKLGKMKGKWIVFCGPGRQSCQKTISRSVTKGSETKDIRSEEVANAVSQSLTVGIESEVKIAGSGSKVKFESTSSFEHSSAITTAKEISSSQQNTKADSEQINVDYKEYDVAVVWRWILTAKSVGDSNEKVTLKTNDYTCTSDITPPSYLPYSPKHVANPCLKKRKAKSLETVAPKAQPQTPVPATTKAIKFSVRPGNSLGKGLPTNPQAACEGSKELFFFFQGQEVWSYNNNNGKVNGPVATSVAKLPGNIDSCVNGHNGKLYFFKGSQYWRYDIKKDAPDTGYPKAISSGWPGLPNSIAAAMRDKNKKLIFISGDAIYHWNMATDKIIPGVGSMRKDFSELPNNIDASIYINAKQLFYGGGKMFNPQTN